MFRDLDSESLTRERKPSLSGFARDDGRLIFPDLHPQRSPRPDGEELTISGDSQIPSADIGPVRQMDSKNR